MFLNDQYHFCLNHIILSDGETIYISNSPKSRDQLKITFKDDSNKIIAVEIL